MCRNKTNGLWESSVVCEQMVGSNLAWLQSWKSSPSLTEKITCLSTSCRSSQKCLNLTLSFRKSPVMSCLTTTLCLIRSFSPILIGPQYEIPTEHLLVKVSYQYVAFCIMGTSSLLSSLTEIFMIFFNFSIINNSLRAMCS